MSDDRPRDAATEALFDDGLALWRAGRNEDAYGPLAEAARRAPDDVHVLFTLGTVCRALARDDEAVAVLSRTVDMVPNFAAGHYNLANALVQLRRMDEAVDHFRAACDLAPDEVDHWKNLGAVLRDLGRLEDALAATERALAVDPANPGARWNRCQTLLLMGRFAEAWPDYAARWDMEEASFPYRAFPQARWDGAPLDGQTILVWGEQGIGDEMVLGTILPEIAAEAAHLIVECERRMVPLFARALPGAEVFARADPPAPRLTETDIDVHAPIGDLAVYRRPDAAAFRPSAGYLQPDPDNLAACRARYDALGPGPKVGLSWQSANPHYKPVVDVPLALWGPIFRVPGIHWVNAQYGNMRADIAAAANRFGVAIHLDETIDAVADLDAWAAQIAALDLVVSISNSTSALAGALGVPVWPMLPLSPEAYWRCDGADTLWFSSMRLFRQTSYGDWGPVVAEVAAALAQFAAR